MPRPSSAILRERRLELQAAIATGRVEDVAGQAARVHAHEHAVAVADVALDHRDVRLAVDDAFVGEDLERAVIGRQGRRRDSPHQRLGAHAVLNRDPRP